jgi:hypothetical protein
MKPLRLQTVIFVFLLALAAGSGCAHKKPVLVAPQQQPPTAAPEPTPTPEPAPAQTTEPQQTEQQPAPEPAEQAKTNSVKTGSKNGQSTAAKKPANEVARNTPGKNKRIIPADKNEPPPPAGIQISPGPTPGDAANSQASTEQLLQSAESNLNGINRQLSKDEEAMKAQIKEFISQSRKAATENDLARAHNLAVKARLLSDELVKTR